MSNGLTTNNEGAKKGSFNFNVSWTRNRSTRAARNGAATTAQSGASTGGSLANFYGPDPDSHLQAIAKGPAQHPLAVMPHNILKGAPKGCYAGMQILQQRTGMHPDEIGYPTPEQAADAKLVADELDKRMKDVETYYGSMERVAGNDAKVFQIGARAQIARMKGTGNQIQTAASVAKAGYVQATQNTQVAANLDGTRRFHNRYRSGIDQIVTQKIAVARGG